jgi:hypothetical protein
MEKIIRLLISFTLSLVLITVVSLTVDSSRSISQTTSPSPSVSSHRTMTGTITYTVNYTVFLPLISQANITTPLEYGVQVDPSNYSSNISHTHNLGFGWIRLQLPWKDIERSPGNLSWGNWDNVINAYNEAGLNILLVITKAPDWARPPDDNKSVEGLPDDPQTYANFVISVTHRYGDKIGAIEVWEDQNIYYAVGGQGRVDVQDYMDLLQLAYTSIKAEYPDILVISGGLTATGAPQPFAIDDRSYLQQMYDLGLKDYCDAIGAKPYGFLNPADSQWPDGDLPGQGYDDHPAFYFRNTMEDYRQIMIDKNDAGKNIWPTEFGWPVWRFTGDDRFIFAQENTLEEQAEFTRRAYEMSKEWGWVGAMFLWNLDYAVTAPNTELANFSILTGGGPTPAYETLRDMPK